MTFLYYVDHFGSILFSCKNARSGYYDDHFGSILFSCKNTRSGVNHIKILMKCCLVSVFGFDVLLRIPFGRKDG